MEFFLRKWHGAAALQALIIRDYPLLWVLSIGFELMELTFQHMLPNFNECWWDSWVLDVAVCNFIGAQHRLVHPRLCLPLQPAGPRRQALVPGSTAPVAAYLLLGKSTLHFKALQSLHPSLPLALEQRGKIILSMTCGACCCLSAM